MRPAFLDSMSWAMSEVYASCTDQILVNLARYFPYIQNEAQVKGAFEYQARMLAQMGQVRAETIFILQEKLGDADDALKGVLEAAILDSLKNEEPKLRRAAEKGLLGSPGQPEVTPNMMQAFQTYYRQAADKMNLVNTVMLDSTEEAYRATVGDVTAKLAKTQTILNEQTGQAVTGVTSYNQAMRDGVRRMVDNGLTGFIDHGGHHWSPEAYVAMDIRTTLFNTGREAVWERNQEYGNDLYQVSSKNAARPLCYPWQGKVLSTSGRIGVTTDLDGNEVTIHGEGEVESFRYGGGLFGVNCGHYPMVFIPGVSTIKPPPQDEEENAEAYAQSQQQRALERKLREEKRDLEVMKAQGATEEEIKAQRQRVRAASNELDDFCEETGRTRRRSREGTPARAEWPGGSNGKVTRYNGGYIGANTVPQPKGAPAQPNTPNTPNTPKNVTPQATAAVRDVVQSQRGKEIEDDLVANHVDAVPVTKWAQMPTQQEIIAEIAGADQTSGSCASVSLAYVGNKAGYKVHDYRGGMSREWFATKTKTLKIAQLPEINGHVIYGKDEVKVANELLAKTEEGKEYWLGVGQHAAIVRKSFLGYEYLELQADKVNGWHWLDDSVLRWRFGCKLRRNYELPARLMDVDKLTQSDDFLSLLKFINTDVGAQRKGSGGGIK